MPISPARQIAYQVLLQLSAGNALAVDLLQRPEVSDLKEPDKRLATEIVMGVLRWRGEIDFQIETVSGKKLKSLDSEVVTILRMGIYQIRFLERVPKRAVVDDAVELTKTARKRSAAGFVNAVMRKYEPPRDRLVGRDFESLSSEDLESIRRAFPAWLLERWKISTASASDQGEVGALRLAYASLQTPRVTLRMVNSDASIEEVRQELEADGVMTSRCRHAIGGLAAESGSVLNSRAYREGRVVIQDEASQLVADLVAPEPGQHVLDLCAAPGMKAGQISQALKSGVFVACDHSAARLRTTARLLPPSVPAGVHLSMVRLDAAHDLPFGAKFERILLDAPCSGTGTLARNPEIKWRLQSKDIVRLSELQTRMLRNALTVLTDGGQLVYATCALEPEENEQVVERVLREEPAYRVLTSPELAAKHPRLVSFFDSRGYFGTHPGQHSMDGFNAAVIVRK